MILLYILAGWVALSIICAPILVPAFARRFARQHEEFAAQSRRRG